MDYRAISEGLKPFHKPDVATVAGVVISKNVKKNILSRFTDLLFVSNQQLIDRSAMSQSGNVLVNSGSLAFYRSPLVFKAINEGYDDEKFLGRKVKFSDDSYLTLYGLMHGKAVQQPSAIVFADMPIKLSHHVRQQLRWSRGSFIRSLWRLKNLPIDSWGYLRQFVGYLVFFSSLSITLQLFVFIPLNENIWPPIELLLVPIILGYLQATRYFTIRRSDLSLPRQIVIFMMAPLAYLWTIVVLRLIRLYSIATCYKTGWGTRDEVEVIG